MGINYFFHVSFFASRNSNKYTRLQSGPKGCNLVNLNMEDALKCTSPMQHASNSTLIIFKLGISRPSQRKCFFHNRGSGKHRVYSTYKFTSGRARNPQFRFTIPDASNIIPHWLRYKVQDSNRPIATGKLSG